MFAEINPVVIGIGLLVLVVASLLVFRYFNLWLQSITTREPEDAMVDVAIASLLAALNDEERAEVEERGPIAAGALAAEVDVPEPTDG